MQKEQVLFALLRNIVCGQPVSEDTKAACTTEMLEHVYALASRHDLAHLVAQAANKLELPQSEFLKKCDQSAKQAIFRYLRLSNAYEQICGTLEKAEIPFIPLKGSVLRDFYPEPWMRTSCDIDILVKAEHLESAIASIKEELQYADGPKGDHDVSLFSAAGIRLELHYDTLAENSAINESYAVLSRIWETAIPKQPGMYQCELTDAMFYFYHIAHMAKHFQIGGCGIRPFLDLWILNHRVQCDVQARRQLLAQGGLLAFAEAAEKLSETWFSGAPMDSMTDQLARYILSGGVYGTMENNVAMQQQKQGGKLQYALSKIILPYETIKFHYPVLQKHKWLTPCYQVVRWFKLLFKGGVKRSVKQLRLNATASREEIQSTQILLQYMGLKQPEK